MARFTYKAKKGVSETVEGIVDADSQEEALSKLTAQKLFPISIVEASQPSIKKAAAAKPARRIKISRRVNSREVLIFTQKLATLMRAKVDLLSSLRVLYEQTENTRLKEIILEIYDSIKEGKTFSESMGHFPKIFSPLFINIIKAGEATGRLDYALEQISEFLHREETLKTKILVALAYPALLLSVGLVSIFVMINFVIPKLRPLFESMGKDLPLITRIILNASTFSNKTWFWILGLVIIFVIFIYYKKGASFYNNMARKIKLKIPVIKRLIYNQELVQFSKSLSLLLNSGVVALKSLEIATLTLENPKLKAELKQVCEEVASGESISKKMDSLTSLPKFFTKMIAVGEESGRLGEVLEEISRSYTQQIESDITLISALIEPILILVLGVILGTIVLSILLPTFQVTQMVH